MRRSTINQAISAAKSFFEKNGWTLPPNPKWDVTDFGLGAFKTSGLVLINLAEEHEYCEKLMYAVKDQVTPAHYHKKKKEDIICRNGILVIQCWTTHPEENNIKDSLNVKVNGEMISIHSGEKISLRSGERITILPYIWHEFYAESEQCIMGEVSTANDDLNDNFFVNTEIGRFSEINEDELAIVKLVSDKK